DRLPLGAGGEAYDRGEGAEAGAGDVEGGQALTGGGRGVLVRHGQAHADRDRLLTGAGLRADGDDRGHDGIRVRPGRRGGAGGRGRGGGGDGFLAGFLAGALEPGRLPGDDQYDRVAGGGDGLVDLTDTVGERPAGGRGGHHRQAHLWADQHETVGRAVP